MIGIGGARPAGGGDGGAVDTTPKLPDAFPSCVAWWDRLVGTTETNTWVEGWTDRVNGIALVAPDPEGIVNELDWIYVYKNFNGELLGPSSFEAGSPDQYTINLGQVNGFDLMFDHFPPELAINDSLNNISIYDSGIPYDAGIADALIDGVSVWDSTFVDKGYAGNPKGGDDAMIYNGDAVGDLDLVFEKKNTRSLSPFYKLATMAISSGNPAPTETVDQGQPLVSIENSNSSSDLHINKHPGGIFSFGLGDGSDPTFIGAASEQCALVVERQEMAGPGSLVVYRVQLYSLIGGSESGYSVLSGSASLILSDPGADTNVAIFRSDPGYPWDNQHLQLADIAFFDDALAPHEVESVLKGFKQKREAL